MAFYNCTKLTRVTIPASVTEIGTCAFARTGLTGVTIPAGMTKIDRVFEGCRELTDVVIPEGVTEIGERAFAGCVKLRRGSRSPSCRTTTGAV